MKSIANIKVGHVFKFDMLNTSYLTDSDINFTLKLESRQIFVLTGQLGQVHMVKEIFPIFLHAGMQEILVLDTDSILRIKTMYKSVR